MSDKKQTAVEWLFDQLCSEKLSWNKDSNDKIFFDKITCDILQQAKEIEKQQIIEAHGDKLKKSKDAGNYEYWFTGKDYYNKTFKNTENEKNNN
jgi:hypothetical protein